MNTNEHLLTCLSEEAAEVIQSCSKALRFGTNDGYPNSNTTNAQDIAKEAQELIAVLNLLEINEVIPKLSDEEKKDIHIGKKQRVMDWMAYAKEQGALE